MCGICGIIKLNNQAAEKLAVSRMMQVMKHRGPDDEGIFAHQNIALGFVRLSIIDLSANGHQPMSDVSGNYTIIFNGEIYNYIELRATLKNKGYKFKSKSDTEVLLNSYLEWGKSCLDKLNGMFAFAIHCKKDNSVFIARDRFGIKPLYFHHDSNNFIFCSEIPPILEVYMKKNEANYQAVYDFLAYNRTDHLEETFFKGISRVEHGTYIEIKDNKLSFKKWYQLEKEINKAEISPEEYLQLLSSSISLRLRSDVPVGVCLSGGIDSSTITSILYDKFNIKELNTFSATYNKGDKGDESDFISEYKGVLNNMYFTYPTAESLFKDQLSLVKAQAEPFPTTGIYAQYKVMQLAQGKVKVLLDGQGADEQLAGYHYFFAYYFKELIKEYKAFILLIELYAYLKKHRSLYALKVLLYLYLPPGFSNKQKVSSSAINPEFSKQVDIKSENVNLLIHSNNLKSSLLNHFEYKLEHLLKWEDRNSMYFSIESRIPFLDYRLVETSLSQPSDTLIRNGSTKALLREAVNGIIPEKIRNRRDKTGFQTPEDMWFRTDFYKDFIFDMFNSSSFKSRELINIDKAKKLYTHHLNNKLNISKEIWKWINLELWFKNFIDN